MVLFNKQNLPPTDDIFCPFCNTPLLNRKSVCPKCGNRYEEAAQKAHPAHTEAGTYTANQSHHPTPVYSSVSDEAKDDLLTSSMIFLAGLGLLYAILSLFISGFGLDDIWRAIMLALFSVIMLGVRRLILKR